MWIDDMKNISCHWDDLTTGCHMSISLYDLHNFSINPDIDILYHLMIGSEGDWILANNIEEAKILAMDKLKQKLNKLLQEI